MNETLLDLAKRNLEVADAALLRDGAVKGVHIIVGSLLHRSTELALKYVLEANGVKYTKTHDISELLWQLPFEPVLSEPLLTSLELAAGTISGMDLEIRYIIKHRTSLSQVKRIKQLVEQLIAEPSSKECASVSSVEPLHFN